RAPSERRAERAQRAAVRLDLRDQERVRGGDGGGGGAVGGGVEAVAYVLTSSHEADDPFPRRRQRGASETGIDARSTADGRDHSRGAAGVSAPRAAAASPRAQRVWQRA